MNTTLIVVDGRIVGAAAPGFTGPGALVPAPDGFSWDNASRYFYEDGQWKTDPPTSVTARQGFIYLHRLGLLEIIEGMFEQLPEPARTEATIEWNKTAVIERGNPLLGQVAQMMNWGEEDLDAMFVEANKI